MSVTLSTAFVLPKATRAETRVGISGPLRAFIESAGEFLALENNDVRVSSLSVLSGKVAGILQASSPIGKTYQSMKRED